MSVPPILSRKRYGAPSIFTPESLLREARRQKQLGASAVPEICVLDPDGDVVVNLLEYAFALNPRAADAPTFTENFSGSGPSAQYTVSYERVRGASDLLYSWTASTDLKNWSPATPSNVVVTPNPSRATEAVTSSFSPATNAHQFFRLGVSLTP